MSRPLTDRDALERQRQRAERRANGPERFLHDRAIQELSERLKDINRTFTKPALIGWQAQYWADQLGFDDAVIAPDAEVLALSEGTHDLVIHCLCLHWANDIVGQLIQMRRALRPDGVMIAALFAGDTLTELQQSLAAAEQATLGGLSPRVLPMADLRTLGGLLQRAGFALPVADVVPSTASYVNLPALMHDLRAMAEANAMADRHKVWVNRRVFAMAQDTYAENFAGDDGRLRATFDIAFLTGWSPDPSQPQPLRPGSGQIPLAKALTPQARDKE